MLAQAATETIAYGAALVASFGLMLRWILGTLTKEIREISVVMHELAKKSETQNLDCLKVFTEVRDDLRGSRKPGC